MKKSIAVLMLGSALLLPNNTSVEASQVDNNELVQKAQDVQVYVLKGQVPTIQFTKYIDGLDVGQIYKLVKSSDKHRWVSTPQKDKKVTEVDQAKPVEKPSTDKPVKNPAPTPTPAPEAKPAPTPAPEKPAKPVQTTPDASISAIEQAVLDLTNAERQKAGLQPLQADRNLMNSARQKSTDMASNKYFSHTSPTYGSPFDQMKANGVTYKSAAENIAMGQRTAEEVVKGWMESPGHRQNILTPEFTHIGIGYDKNGNYWTQQFIQK
jgi:uncharacterized YkwD family protein